MANTIRPPKAPNLPLAPLEYARTYFDQFASMLRLYFNQLDGYNSVVTPTAGNFQSTTTQTLSAANTATLVTLDTTQVSNGVSVSATSQITTRQSGKFLFSFTVAGGASGWGGGPTRYIWFRLNGTDIVESTHNSSGSCLIDLTPADYVEMYWASSNPLDTLAYTAATAFCPATPAINLIVTFVST